MADIFVGGLAALILIAALILALTGKRRVTDGDRTDRERGGSSWR